MKEASVKLFRSALLCILAAAVFSLTAQAQNSATPAAIAQASTGKVTICDQINDDWKCVGATTPWPADKPFNILLELPKAIDVDFIGFVIHKRDEKGVDTDFVDEYMLTIQGNARLFATTEGFRLPAGRYTVYGIKWSDRQLNFHPGNFKEYLGKTELIVK